MNIKILLTIIIFSSSLFLKAQNITIPDQNFRAELLSSPFINTDKDLEISEQEALAVRDLYIPGKNIQSLTGIEHFVNLKTLICYGNKITSLDLSKCPKIYQLSCEYNELTNLNLSNCVSLYFLDCYKNKLTTLDASQTAAYHFNCSYNQLQSLILPTRSIMSRLYCDHNQLTTLDFSMQKDASILHCNDNLLTDIKLPKAGFSDFNCINNQLTSLDLSSLINLGSFKCANNQLEHLNLMQFDQLFHVDCSGNPKIDTICIPSISIQFMWGFKKDALAVWSRCQSESPMIECMEHISDNGVCEDFKDGDLSSASIDEYAQETSKTRWENGAPVNGENAYRGLFWTESTEKNGFTAQKYRHGDGILQYVISQKDSVYEPILLVFGNYAENGKEKKMALDLSNDKTMEFEFKNLGDSSLSVYVQLEDMKGNNLVFETLSGENTQIGSSSYNNYYENNVTWTDNDFTCPRGKSKFNFDFAHAICGITEEAIDAYGNPYLANVPHAEIKFDYSQVTMVKFFISGYINTDLHHDLKAQKIEISNFRLGSPGLINGIFDTSLEATADFFTAYDLMGNYIDHGKESELKLLPNHIYILKSAKTTKKKIVLE